MKLFLKNAFDFKDHDGSSLLRPKKLIIELAIVFVGVYSAFLLSDYSDNRKLEVQRTKILISLKGELEFMKSYYPGQREYQEKMVKIWKDSLQSDQIVDFFEWRYVQPQYNYMVIEYAVNSRESGVVDFSMYKKLLNVYQAVKQVEYAEEKMTELGLQYRPLPAKRAPDLNSADFQYNRFLFSRFIVFASDRASILQRISDNAREVLAIIDQKFSPDELRSIEKDIVVESLVRWKGLISEEDIKGHAVTMFPKMPDEDVKEIIHEMAKIRDSGAK